MGCQQQPEQGVGVALGPGEYIDEIRFENDMIEFIFTFSPVMIYYYHENMARQYFFSMGLFYNLFDISYQPVLVLDAGADTHSLHFLVHGDGGGVALDEV